MSSSLIPINSYPMTHPIRTYLDYTNNERPLPVTSGLRRALPAIANPDQSCSQLSIFSCSHPRALLSHSLTPVLSTASFLHYITVTDSEYNHFYYRNPKTQQTASLLSNYSTQHIQQTQHLLQLLQELFRAPLKHPLSTRTTGIDELLSRS